jgi:hypothetical protein
MLYAIVTAIKKPKKALASQDRGVGSEGVRRGNYPCLIEKLLPLPHQGQPRASARVMHGCTAVQLLIPGTHRDLRSSRPFSADVGVSWVFSLVGTIASATKLLREEGGRRPEMCSRWRRIYDLWPVFTLYSAIWG